MSKKRTIDSYFRKRNEKRKREEESSQESNSLSKIKKKKTNEWSKHYVRLPHRRENIFRKSGKNLSKWYLIKTVLSSVIPKNVGDLVNIVKKINPESKDRKFYNLINFFNENLKRKDSEKFFEKILPKMQQAVLDCEVFFKDRGVCVLHQRKEMEVVLNRRECACLLSCAFFCVIPEQGNEKMPSSMNFLRLYTTCRPANMVFEKLKTLLNYFVQYFKGDPIEGSVCFKRCVVEEKVDWDRFDSTSHSVFVYERGFIEDYHPFTSSHVDFANRYIGGGVLGHGCVQEEILFLTHPELIVSRLFCEKLRNNECLIASGQHKYSTYEGYARTYRFKGSNKIGSRNDSQMTNDTNINSIPKHILESDERLKRTNLICIDAIDFKKYRDPLRCQFKKMMIRRELDKCYIGFKNASNDEIVTGNWGCGAFGGNHQLKALIQILAASVLNKRLVYFTFADPSLSSDKLREFVQFINDNRVPISQCFEFMTKYYDERNGNEDLFGFISRKICDVIVHQELSFGDDSFEQEAQQEMQDDRKKMIEDEFDEDDLRDL